MQTRIVVYLLGVVLFVGSFTAAYGQSTPDQVVRGTYVVDIPAGAYLENAEFYYKPGSIAVPAGTTVVWFNDDTNQIHTVTSGEPSDEDAGSAFGSDFMQEGAFFQHTFTEAGEYPYFCTIHPWMVGSVSVSDAVWEGHFFNVGMGTGATFDFNQSERTLLTFTPTTIEVSEDAPVNYRLSILKDGEELFSEDFLTLGGILHVELIPTDSPTSVYGPDVSDPVIGAYHIEGSFLKDNAEFKVRPEITTIAGEAPDSEIADEFGIQIVPEFPLGAMSAALAGIGASIAIARKKFRVFGSD
jgi:plastocyanin